MMNYEIFKEVVKEKFMDYMPEKFKGMELVAEPVEKVNVTLDGIILREEGRNISPTIYINDMYKKYQECGDLEETLMAACDFMERAYEQAPVVDVDSIMRDANEKIPRNGKPRMRGRTSRTLTGAAQKKMMRTV